MTNKPEVYSPDELANKLKLSAKVIANHALQLGILVTLDDGEQYVEVADIGKLLKALKKNYAQALKVDGVSEKLQKLADYALEQKALVKAREEARRLREAEEQQQKEQEQLRREEELKQVDPETGLPLKLLELTKAVLDPMSFHCGTYSFLRQLIYTVEANIKMEAPPKELHELYPDKWERDDSPQLGDKRSRNGKLKPQDFRGLHNYSGNKEDVSFSLNDAQKAVFFDYLLSECTSTGLACPASPDLAETLRVIAAVDKWEVPLTVPMLEMWRLEGIRLQEERRARLEAYTLQAQATAL
jgi:hypothetical protein